MRLILLALFLLCSILSVAQQPSNSFGLKKDQAFMAYVTRNVRFPMKAQRMGVMAKIYAGFQVNGNGDVQNVVILNEEHVGYGFEEEAVKVLKRSPRQPFRYEGNYAIPFSFGYGAPEDPNPQIPTGKLSDELLGSRQLLDEVMVLAFTRTTR